MVHKNLAGRQIGWFRNNRGWSQATLGRELQIAEWDISRSEISKIEMRIREVKDWQMMLLVRVLGQPYEGFYPRLKANIELRDAFATVMAEPSRQKSSRYHSSRSHRGCGRGAGWLCSK